MQAVYLGGDSGNRAGRGEIRQGREGSSSGCNEHLNSVGNWGTTPLRASGDGLEHASELSHWRGVKEPMVPQ